MRKTILIAALAALSSSSSPSLSGLAALAAEKDANDQGIRPTAADGRPLNFDFETGTLDDWKAEGDAFKGQPVKGDLVSKRRADMKSRHQGEYWIGGFETGGDQFKGRLTSVPFKLTHPFVSFLVGGGPQAEERVEILLADTGTVIFRTTGHEAEDLEREVVDLTPHVGKEIVIRLVDDHTGHWGHINFDDFRLHATKPTFETRRRKPVPPVDVVKHAGLTGEQAAKAMTLRDGFTATLFAAEPDVHQPIGFTIDARGRLWVAEAHNYPRKGAPGEGKDVIAIFEDADNDGKFDKRTVFAEGLNLVSGIEVGFGGVWVGAAPEFLFIPDRDGDDRPDGPPQVLLDGWGYQDTHETLNSFIWGPDGWLYGCHGVFTHSKVGKPGTPDDQRVGINAGVWRYHPTKHVFEVFAEGGSNQWGVDFDDHGQAFMTACVIPHLYHVVQGGHYLRQAGKHFNPHLYKDLQPIGDHVHWAGDKGPHAGNNRSDAAGGGHAHCGAMIYLGDAFPPEYRNTIFMSNIHGNRFNNDILVPKGSGFVGKHGQDFLRANDQWFRGINVKTGPDGSVFLIDWYDKQACHLVKPEVWDRTNGRIYKVTYGKPKAPAIADVAKLPTEQLVALQGHANDFYVRHARRVLQERGGDDATRAALASMMAREANVPRRLRAMWALHAIGGFTDALAMAELKHADPYVRAWAIQLAAEDGQVPAEMLAEWARLAKEDPSPVVRLYLASAMQRLPEEQRWDVMAGLLAHEEDAADHNLPAMVWYALEPMVAADPVRALKLAGTSKLPDIRTFVARRAAARGK